jgi:hypothetical protein
MITNGEAGLRDWLETPDAADVLDGFVLGSLLDYEVEEICEDFGVTRKSFVAAVDSALRDGF